MLRKNLLLPRTVQAVKRSKMSTGRGHALYQNKTITDIKGSNVIVKQLNTMKRTSKRWLYDTRFKQYIIF